MRGIGFKLAEWTSVTCCGLGIAIASDAECKQLLIVQHRAPFLGWLIFLIVPVVRTVQKRTGVIVGNLEDLYNPWSIVPHLSSSTQ